MSIVAEQEVQVREFSGWTDPQFPSGYWSSAGVGIGDASGGLMTIQINFSRATDQRNSQFYSLEQLFCWIQASSTQQGELILANFDLGRGASTNRIMNASFVSSPTGNSSFRSDLMRLPNGLFLGRQADALTSTSLSLVLVNVTGIVTQLRVEGYIWDARSVAVPGGPQRPPTGVYR